MKGIKDIGVGVDIEDIARFRKLDRGKNSSFLNKIFTREELDYCFSKGEAAPSLTARYAGKEAVVKALSGIGKEIINYKEIEILSNDIGAPIVKINNRKFRDILINISLSHCNDKAVAFAVTVKKEM